MLERAPKVGDYIMWPDSSGELYLLYVHAVRGEDDFFVTDITSMGQDILPRSITYAMTGKDDAMTGGPAERARERAKHTRFATAEEVAEGWFKSETLLKEQLKTTERHFENAKECLKRLYALIPVKA